VTRGELELCRDQNIIKYNVMEKTIEAWNRRTGEEEDGADAGAVKAKEEEDA
jgi:hypothetical protein